MSASPVVVSPSWLALREEADARARSLELVREVQRLLPPVGRIVIQDLGCGTGSMDRWLAPLLTGQQHWTLSDRDADLLAIAATRTPARSADGAPVTVETRQRDITDLAPGELAGSSLITAAALLDLLTADELDRFVAARAGAGCPELVTLSVVGLITQWLAGWVGAAAEQEPDLAAVTTPYLERRRAEAVQGRLSVTVHQGNLLALPRSALSRRPPSGRVNR